MSDAWLFERLSLRIIGIDGFVTVTHKWPVFIVINLNKERIKQ